MKKLVFLLCVGFFFISCKKEYSLEDNRNSSTLSSYYIKANVNGIPKTFNYEATATTLSDGQGSFALDISGYAFAAISNLQGISLTIYYQNVPPASGSSYQEYYPGSEYYIEGVYNPNSTTTIYTAGYGYPTSTFPLNITITTLTSTEITGTFSGAFYKTDVGTGDIFNELITITSGEFKLKLQ